MRWAFILSANGRDTFRQLAAELGFTFHSHRDHHFADRYQFLNKLAQGSNRYAYNILTGASDRGETVHIFDYHYETYSTNSKGHRQTHHHEFSFFILLLPRSFPELTIGREGFLSKIAQAVGYDDIDFESHEFSRKFCVRSRDKKFAYDVCNAQMIEYLLDNADLGIEIDGPALALGFSSRLRRRTDSCEPAPVARRSFAPARVLVFLNAALGTVHHKESEDSEFRLCFQP